MSMPAPANHLLKPFYPALDGLRALAILMVFAYHCVFFIPGVSAMKWGWVGVDLFFVLSGFLITGILFDTLHQPRFFRDFYVRRALRIFPLFYGFWILFLLLTPLLHSIVKIGWNNYSWFGVFYLGNFFQSGAIRGIHPDPFALTITTASHPSVRLVSANHLWSLAVEEQFYFVWPMVVWFVRSRRTLLRICFATIVFVPLLRWFLYLHLSHELIGASFLYRNTFTRMDDLLVGAALALWLRGPAVSLPSIRKGYAGLFAVPLLALTLLMISSLNRWPSDNENPIVNTIGFSLIALISASLLLAAIDVATPFSRILNTRPLISIGRLSYGIYFFHIFVIQVLSGRSMGILNKSHHLAPLVAIISFAITYALAWLSFRFFESPFLRLKSRLAPRPGGMSDPPAAPLAILPSVLPFDTVRPSA